MSKPRILFWHRRDLRIFDNQALINAFSLSNAITSTYIFDKNYPQDFIASSRAWFLGNSLQELGNNWKKMGSRLIIEEGVPVLIIPNLAIKIDAKFVFWNRSIEPYEINRDLNKLNSEVEGDLDEDIEVLILDPDELDNLISSGDEILDAKTVTAWFRAKQFLDKLWINLEYFFGIERI